MQTLFGRGLLFVALLAFASMVNSAQGANDLGSIALWNPDQGGIGYCEVPSTVITNGILGTTVEWSEVAENTAPAGVFDPSVPSRITIPIGSGIKEINISASIFWPLSVNGFRWIRLIRGSSSHMSGFAMPTNGTAVYTVTPVNTTGWVPVQEGDYFTIHAIQDSGSPLILGIGTWFGYGGSSYFRASFR